MHKHICLHEVDNQTTSVTADTLNTELDQLISFEMFLTVAGLEEITVKVETCHILYLLRYNSGRYT